MHARRSTSRSGVAIAGLVLAVPATATLGSPARAGEAVEPGTAGAPATSAQSGSVDGSAAGWTRQSPVPTGQRLNGVDMVSATTAWAVGERGAIVHTDDGGGTWRRQRSGTSEQLNAVSFADSLHGLAMATRPCTRPTAASRGNGAVGRSGPCTASRWRTPNTASQL